VISIAQVVVNPTTMRSRR